MPYSVTLERGSDATYLAWVHELVGCFARAATREEVLAKVRDEIRAFLSWSGNGGAEVEIEVVDEVQSSVPAADDTEVLLEPDREPLTERDWRRIEDLLRASRRDLLRILHDADPDDLDWQPDGRPRTIAGEIQHVAWVELMYVLWTFDLGSRAGLEELLDWTREAAVARMRAVAAADRGAVTRAEWAGAAHAEQWTARKAARRLVWHERLHAVLLEGSLARRTRE